MTVLDKNTYHCSQANFSWLWTFYFKNKIELKNNFEIKLLNMLCKKNFATKTIRSNEYTNPFDKSIDPLQLQLKQI